MVVKFLTLNKTLPDDDVKRKSTRANLWRAGSKRGKGLYFSFIEAPCTLVSPKPHDSMRDADGRESRIASQKHSDENKI